MAIAFGSRKVTSDHAKGNARGVMRTNARWEWIQDRMGGKELANVL